MKHYSAITLAVIGLALAGCATTTSPAPRAAVSAATGDPVADGLAMVERAPKKDRVLWQYRTALQAMRRANFPLAKQLLDDALLTIGNVFGPDKAAKKSRGLFNEEAKKTFIGEPYERAMAYFYRGLLYWMDGQPDNARACFRSAQLADSDAENKTYAGDFILCDYLDGLATLKLGGDSSDGFKRAQANASQVTLPAYNPKANVLFFIELGPGPNKYSTGEYGQELRFRTFVSPVHYAVIKSGGRELARLAKFDDVNFQATTRGGRVMDHVLANKAVFKTTTDTVGNVAVVSGAILATQRDTREAGLAVLGAGLLGKIIASAANPAADTRAWDNLPQFLTFSALEMPPGPHQVTIEFLNADQQTVGTFTKQLTIRVKEPPADTVIFISDQSITPQNL